MGGDRGSPQSRHRRKALPPIITGVTQFGGPLPSCDAGSALNASRRRGWARFDLQSEAAALRVPPLESRGTLSRTSTVLDRSGSCEVTRLEFSIDLHVGPFAKTQPCFHRDFGFQFDRETWASGKGSWLGRAEFRLRQPSSGVSASSSRFRCPRNSTRPAPASLVRALPL